METTIQQMAEILFGKAGENEKIDYRLELKHDSINETNIFILKSDNTELKNIVLGDEDLTIIPVGFAHRWQSNFNAIKDKENLYSDYYRFNSENEIIIKEKDNNGKVEVLHTFSNEKELFEKLGSLTGKLRNINRINILFAYIPKIDKLVKIFIPYLSFKNSGIANILKNSGSDIINYELIISSKTIINQQKNEILVFDFKKDKKHSKDKNFIKEQIKKVFGYLKN